MLIIKNMFLKTQRFLSDRNYAINKTLHTTYITLCVIAILIAVKVVTEIANWSQIGEGNYPENTISVNGEGEVTMVPDVGRFTFSANFSGESVSSAQEESAKVINKAIDFLKENGVEEKDVKTISYNVYPKYEYNNGCTPGTICIESRNRNPVLVGYTVDQSVQVTIRKTEDAGNILSKIGNLGITNVSGLSFEIDDPSKAEEEARALAIEDAKEKAKKLAKDLGVKLKKVVSFNESSYYPEPYYAKGLGGGDMMMEASVAPNMPIGENSVQRTVYITYEIK
jgi:uncharacterized protein